MKDRISKCFAGARQEFYGPDEARAPEQEREHARLWFFMGFAGCMREQAILSQLNMPPHVVALEMNEAGEEIRRFFEGLQEQAEDYDPGAGS